MGKEWVLEVSMIAMHVYAQSIYTLRELVA